MKTKIYLSALLLLFFGLELSAQLDTKHWIPPFFAKVENNSGTSNIRDHFVSLTTPAEDTIPVIIRNGFGDLIDTVFIAKAMPQEYIFGPQGQATGNPETSVYPLNVIPRDSLNRPIRSQGLYFESFQPFFVNMRHKSISQGFSLTSKGQVGLGTEFYSGHIYTIRNTGGSWNNDRRSHFISFMATEDNTTITVDMIKAPIKFIGQEIQGEPITVTLDALESYVLGVDHNDLSNEDINNLNGTRITSDKPIVCNSGSWLSGNSNGQCIGADQLVTAEVTGQEYILVRGRGNETTERPCIIAIEDGTEVFLNDEPTPIAALDKGEFIFIEEEKFTENDNLYILATEKVYCFQTSSGQGINDDGQDKAGPTVGLNFIPPLNCIGAKEVELPFVTSLVGTGPSAGSSKVNIITKFGTSVFVNGNPTPLTGAQTVTGNPEWVTYAYFPSSVDETINIVSDSVMNVGQVIEDDNVGAAGYFSGFTLEPVVGLSSEIVGETPCIPGNAVLQVFGFDTYQWFFEGEEIEGATSSSLVPTFAGQYSVEGIDIACGFRFPSNPFDIPYCPSTLGAAKQVQNVQETSVGSRIFDITYSIFIENFAESTSQNIQIIEDIQNGLPAGATAELMGEPALSFNFLAGGLNPDFDGIIDTKLLPGNGFLSGFTEGQVINQDAITLTIRVDMNNAEFDGYLNQAVVTSINEGVNDGVSGPFNGQDFSNAGDSPDPDGDGEPNEEGENEPNLTCFFPNTFEYSAESYCITDDEQLITQDGVSTGIFTSDIEGLSIVDTTGIIRPQESTPGTYTVTFTVEGRCPTVTTTEVTIIGTPVPGTGSTVEVCEQSEIVVLNDLLDGEDEGGVWTNASDEVVGAQFDPVSPGENVFTYTVISEPCAAESANVTVNVAAEPNSGTPADNTSYCEDQTQVALDDLITDQQLDGTWTDSEENVLSENFVITGPGDFTLTYTVSNESCGERSTDVVVSVVPEPLPAITLGPDTYCQGETVDLDDLLTETDPNGEWFDSDGLPSSNEVVASELGEETYTYTITVEPCPSVSTEVAFNVIEADMPGTPNDENNEFCDESAQVINLDAFLDDQDAGGQWTDSEGNEITANVNLGNLAEGSYTYTYTVSNAECGDLSASVIIELAPEFCEVDPPLPKPFSVPQGFSPNGDGINDVFVITSLNEFFPNNSIQIFNRWGAEVLSAAPYNNDWAGKAETGLNAGEVLPVGTYWYILDLGDGTEPIMDFIYLNR
ncbi:MAG: gliding motility-associated C-terminal domain-containing protein [Flavobacteriales bacterium]|nr:gliding motility-associated C-terminal domain-containing protein [Flavobacteriales bacterium]